MLDQSENKKRLLQLLAILLTGGVAMFFATLVDRPFSQWLREHSYPTLDEFMASSFFEGEMFGAGDITVITMIFCLIIYFVASHFERKNTLESYSLSTKTIPYLPWWLDTPTKIASLRPVFGYLLVNGLCVAVLMVHPLKWIMARPRPLVVLNGTFPFNEWYEIGAHFIAEGAYRGGFPSGHTGSSAAMFGLAYCVVLGAKSEKGRVLGKYVLGFVFLLAVTMAFSRIMTAAHWVTDVVFSFFGGIAIAHTLYFWGLRIPEQMHNSLGQRVTQRSSYFELKICGLLFLATLGGIAICLGIRSLVILQLPWILLVILAGAVVSYFSMKLAVSIGFFNKILPVPGTATP